MAIYFMVYYLILKVLSVYFTVFRGILIFLPFVLDTSDKEYVKIYFSNLTSSNRKLELTLKITQFMV